MVSQKPKDSSKPVSNAKYTGDQIVVLEGLDPVRKRPAMYIGSTSLTGVHHSITEIIGNSVTVIDDGRGIPVDKVPKYKVSALEIVMTKLHAGGKFDSRAYKVSGGLHGVGASVVNALSSYMKVEVHRDGKVWVQEYKKGKPLAIVKSVGQANDTGTISTFQPDTDVFPST